MDPYANMGCVLKVNASCEGCKMKVLDVLSSVCGTYMVTIDAETGLTDIQGQVEPNVLLYTLAQSGHHAELVKVKLQHPALQMMHPHSHPFNNYAILSNSCGYSYGHYGHGGGHPIHDPYWYERKLRSLDSSFSGFRSTISHHHSHACCPRHAPINKPWISGACHHHHRHLH